MAKLPASSSHKQELWLCRWRQQSQVWCGGVMCGVGATGHVHVPSDACGVVLQVAAGAEERLGEMKSVSRFGSVFGSSRLYSLWRSKPSSKSRPVLTGRQPESKPLTGATVKLPVPARVEVVVHSHEEGVATSAGAEGRGGGGGGGGGGHQESVGQAQSCAEPQPQPQLQPLVQAEEQALPQPQAQAQVQVQAEAGSRVQPSAIEAWHPLMAPSDQLPLHLHLYQLLVPGLEGRAKVCSGGQWGAGQEHVWQVFGSKRALRVLCAWQVFGGKRALRMLCVWQVFGSKRALRVLCAWQVFGGKRALRMLCVWQVFGSKQALCMAGVWEQACTAHAVCVAGVWEQACTAHAVCMAGVWEQAGTECGALGSGGQALLLRTWLGLVLFGSLTSRGARVGHGGWGQWVGACDRRAEGGAWGQRGGGGAGPGAGAEVWDWALYSRSPPLPASTPLASPQRSSLPPSLAPPPQVSPRSPVTMVFAKVEGGAEWARRHQEEVRVYLCVHDQMIICLLVCA